MAPSATVPHEGGGHRVIRDLYRILLTARWVDRVEMELVNRGEAFFHVGGSGHEMTAALAPHLTPQDWLHLHYRDKALMLARGLPVDEFFHSLLCTRDSHSAGRQMSAHFSAPSLNLLSLVGPVGNNALQAVGVAAELWAREERGETFEKPPVVVCAMGDGTTQQGEVLEAIAEAVRSRLRVLFLIEDNHLAISTRTRGQTFFDGPHGPADSFYGLPIHRWEGWDPERCLSGFGEVVEGIRQDRGPALVVLQMERLTHHTNADDERQYREAGEMEQVREHADPRRALERLLLKARVPREELEALDASIEKEVRAAAERALSTPDPIPSLEARPPALTCGADEVDPAFNGSLPGRNAKGPGDGQGGQPAVPVTLLEALRRVLDAQLARDGRVHLYGQDLEDPKGDVFGLTRGLTRAHPGRVRNAPLSESTIVGVSIGRALAGGRPVACIQFADFLPLAFNQIASELGSLYWRSAGGWRAPVVVMAPCGGYRPGLGPFHAQTFEATFAHVPGLDVVMPSSAADAAGLLNAILAQGRPTLFLYPKVLLNDAAVATSDPVESAWVEPGRARRVRAGSDLTLVTWGATVSLAGQVAGHLERAGMETDLLDLRSLSPWDRDTVLESVSRTGRLLVVHEDNLTCGFGAEVAATVAERSARPVSVRRVARADTYVPCNYPNQRMVLPSVRTVLEAAASLCGLEVTWETAAGSDGDVPVIEAVGSSPADQNVTVLEWRIQVGDRIEPGQLIAECEADKAAFELRASVGGRVAFLQEAGVSVKVGTPLVRLEASANPVPRARRVIPEGTPVLRPIPVLAPPTRPVPGVGTPGIRPGADASVAAREPGVGVAATVDCRKSVVGLTGFHFVTGSRCVTNEELIQSFPGRTCDDIVRRTGIESRYFCGPDEDALTLATTAARSALQSAGIGLNDLSAILVSTSTPVSISPSLACLLHHALGGGDGHCDVQASDILAACSGWLYALQTAFDLCQVNPSANVLVVTSEAMSRFVDSQDFDTAIVFGDAATATVVRGAAHLSGDGPLAARLHRPVLSARGEDGSILNMGRMGRGTCQPVEMHGVRVFPLAVRQMNRMLHQACEQAGWKVSDLEWIVPHQANGRIITAAQERSGLPADRMVRNVARYGNTSSSSIPIALAEMQAQGRKGRTALAAFGGGFTFAAAALEWV